MQTTQKRLLASVASAMLCLALVPAQATSASAATTCSAYLDKRANTFTPDDYRAGAKCSSINVNNRARAKLTIGCGIFDKYSSWFTQLNTYYYTGYTNSDCSKLAGYEVAPV